MRAVFAAWLMMLLLPFGAFAAPSFDIQTVPVGSAKLPAWLVTRSAVPVISVVLQFRQSGYAYDDETRQGRAMLTAQLLQEGAGVRDAASFQEALESHAIELSAGVDEDFLTVRLSTLRENADLAFALLADAVTKPRFDPEAIERLRRRDLSMLRRLEEEPGYKAGRLWRSVVYANHPYRFSSHGTPEGLAALKRDDLTAFAARHLTRGALMISVSGDASAEDVMRWLAPLVNGLPSAANPPIPEVPQALALSTPAPLTEPMALPQTQVIFSLPGLPRSDPSYFTLMLLNQVVGGDGGLSSRLGQAIRDQKGLAYSVSSHLDTNAASAQWIGSFATRNEQANAALQTLYGELVRLGNDGITEAELADAKSYLIGSLAVSLDGTGPMAGFLALLQRHDLGQDYFTTRTQRLSAVTRQQVNELAARMFLRRVPTVAAVGAPSPALEGQKGPAQR